MACKWVSEVDEVAICEYQFSLSLLLRWENGLIQSPLGRNELNFPHFSFSEWAFLKPRHEPIEFTDSRHIFGLYPKGNSVFVFVPWVCVHEMLSGAGHSNCPKRN